MPPFAFGSFVLDEVIFNPMVEYPWTDAVIVDRMDAFVPIFFESPRAHAKACKGNVKGIAKKKIISF